MTEPRYDRAQIEYALGASGAIFLGAGAFGDTWRVGNEAVKVICADGYPPARVAREIAGLLRVSSPNVVKLIRAGTVTLEGIDRPALTFEYVEGGDLGARLTSGELPSDDAAVSLLRGLLSGVRDLHAADGTVHRDIKPPNVALRDGQWEHPVILDLGLARSMTESTVTRYPGLIGTAAYMSPEQLEGRRARKAADLFAVGVTVRAVVLGEHPFYQQGVDYTIDEALELIAGGPTPLPRGFPDRAKSVLDRLVSPAEYERGSAVSNLRRLAET